MRLFITLFPPQEYLTYFRDVMRHFNKHKRNLKLEPIEKIHINLKFLGGRISPDSKDQLVHELQKHAGNYSKPEIELGNIRFGFTKETFPKILLSEVKSTKSLIMLNEQVHGVVRDLYLDETVNWKEKHSNNFHITLGKIKPNATRSATKGIGDVVKEINLPKPESYVADEMYLLLDDLNQSGNTFTKLERIKL